MSQEIKTTNDFHQAIREHWSGHFVFRGEDSDSYTLRPKWGRAAAENGENTPLVEISLLEEFKRKASPFLGQLPNTEWEWLSLAQHHGLATRLLDWTENPLVAAYFATKPIKEQTRDRVLYILDVAKIQNANIAKSPFALDQTVLYWPKHISMRIASQGGLFTAHAQPSQQFSCSGLERCVIKKECFAELQITIRHYGINEATAFMDLDGLARHLTTVFMRGAKPTLKQVSE